MSTANLTIVSQPFQRCCTDVLVSVGESSVSQINQMITLIVESGANRLQTYMTRDEALKLTKVLLNSIDELDELDTPTQIIERVAA